MKYLRDKAEMVTKSGPPMVVWPWTGTSDVRINVCHGGVGGRFPNSKFRGIVTSQNFTLEII